MTRRVPVVVIAMLTMAVAIPFSPALADPIVITGGSVVISNPLGGATGHLKGTHEFVADPVFFGTVNGPFQCQPCGAPGMPFSPTGSMNTVDGGGTVQLGSRSFAAGSIGGISNDAYLQLGFVAGPVVLPPLSASAVVSTPFELAGSLSVWDETGFPLASFSLSGRGTATMDLIPSGRGDDLWEFGRLRYDFAPVPEPATLLLLGTGVLALGARRQRARPRQIWKKMG